MTQPIVVLVGVPGSGKTTIGRELAYRLGVAFRDTDADVAQRAGKSVSDIFLVDGEEEFRLMEREAVATAVAEHEGVLALGGGAVLADDTRAVLAPVTTVWLQAAPDTSSSRVGMSRSRPLLVGNVHSQMIALSKERAPLYEEVADLIVTTDDRSQQEIVDEIIAELNLAGKKR